MINNYNYVYAKRVLLEKLRKRYGPEAFSDIGENNVKVACILDEFSYNCFRYEGQFYQLDLKNWKKTIDNVKPDFLLVESAWEGLNKTWSSKIAHYYKSSDKTLEKIVKYCKLNQIPTVFWAKEDPSDYSIFIDAARLFDYVFTTDENMIKEYKKDLNHNNIHLLPFAAQPKIHNPVDKDKEKKGDLIFAGGWYVKFPQRCKEMEYLLDGASKYDLTIYDRFHDSKINKRNIFPDKYRKFIVNGLDYTEIVKTYKKYKILLNANSVTNSPTTFSRRVFESMACGIPVVSTYAKGIEIYFNEIVQMVNNKMETELLLKKLLNNKEYLDKLSLLGIREIMNNHTYKHRLDTILEVLNLDKPHNDKDGVSVITVTNRKFQLDNIVENYINQTFPNKELIIIINKNSINLDIWKELLSFRDDIKVFKKDESISLGQCLNFGIEKSRYNYISKFDDDDYYGPNYLTDAINAFKYTDASIVGKYTIYAYMQGSKELIVRNPGKENRYVDYVTGSTLTFKKEICNHIKFMSSNKSEDTFFLKESLKLGYKIYSIDRFNHVVSRRPNLRTHTWRISEVEFKKKSKPIAKTKDFKKLVYI